MSRADFTISPYGRATCPVCGDDISLKQNGTLRHHDDKRPKTILPFHERCKGAGRAPGVVALPGTEAGDAR